MVKVTILPAVFMEGDLVSRHKKMAVTGDSDSNV
jgi:hypothetical protein